MIVGALTLAFAGCDSDSPSQRARSAEDRASLRSTLEALAEKEADPLVQFHFRSMLQVIASETWLDLGQAVHFDALDGLQGRKRAA